MAQCCALHQAKACRCVHCFVKAVQSIAAALSDVLLTAALQPPNLSVHWCGYMYVSAIW